MILILLLLLFKLFTLNSNIVSKHGNVSRYSDRDIYKDKHKVRHTRNVDKKCNVVINIL